ncbi:MAG: FAD-dependent oxidoreductase [Planctomycetota bacterium]
MLDSESISTEFCVIGGGMAGICAALAAARCGTDTVLMHDRPVPGGNASSECRVHICGANQSGGRPNARETGIIEELLLTNLKRNPQRSYSVWDTVLWEALNQQPNLRVLYNCSCRAARVEDRQIRSVAGWQLTTQKEIEVEAAFFADCTGDAIMTPIAGADARRGREGRKEFGESLAPTEPDEKTMGMSCLFGGVQTDRPHPFTPPDWAYTFESCDDLPHRHPRGPEFGYWWIERGGDGDSIADTEEVRDELIRIVYGIWDHLKNHCPDAETENWAIDWVGFLPGKRESRRLVGDHLLCQGDIESGGRFDDTVAYGGWSMDRHPPEGFWSPDPPAAFGEVPEPYGIPLRSLYSRNVENLWMAGRNASCTHIGMSSTRVMATGAVMGQAVGTAAAHGLSRGLSPRECAEGSAVRAVQQKLLANDCYLPGFRREFAPLTRTAGLQAGSGDPAALRDGLNRPTGDGEHAWRAAPGDWVAYRWPEPQELRSLTVAFDSNLSEAISLSYHNKNRRTETPPELVKRFRVEAEVDGRWRPVAEEDDNYLRFRTLRFEDLRATAVRLTAHETHGADEVRLFTLAVNEPAPDTFETSAPEAAARTVPGMD